MKIHILLCTLQSWIKDVILTFIQLCKQTDGHRSISVCVYMCVCVFSPRCRWCRSCAAPGEPTDARWQTAPGWWSEDPSGSPDRPGRWGRRRWRLEAEGEQQSQRRTDRIKHEPRCSDHTVSSEADLTSQSICAQQLTSLLRSVHGCRRLSVSQAALCSLLCDGHAECIMELVCLMNTNEPVLHAAVAPERPAATRSVIQTVCTVVKHFP